MVSFLVLLVFQENINFELKKGEIIGVIGPSGAGKSTLLRCINRLIDPNEGKVYLENEEITSVNSTKVRNVRRRIGMIFQHYNLINRLSVMQNVMHGRLGYMNTINSTFGIYTEEDKRKAVSLLEMTGLHTFMYNRAGDLSGGQKQRVGILRAIMQEPLLLLCDEPIASLDPASAHIVMDLIRKVAKENNIACLINLHQIDVAIQYSDRIIGMKNGRIIFNDEASKLDEQMIEEIYSKPMRELMIGGESYSEQSQ